MTAADLARPAVHEVVPVDGTPRRYVVIWEMPNGVLLVRPGPSAGRLPKLWPQWLRRMILDAYGVESGTCRIDIRDRLVYISSPNDPETLRRVVMTTAAQLRPLERTPLRRVWLDHSNKRFTWWCVTNIDVRGSYGQPSREECDQAEAVVRWLIEQSGFVRRDCRFTVKVFLGPGENYPSVIIGLERSRLSRRTQKDLVTEFELAYMLTHATLSRPPTPAIVLGPAAVRHTAR